MFGSGLIELLAREMTADLHAIRAQAIEDARTLGEPAIMNLVAKGVNFGRITASPDGSAHLGEVEGVDEDLIIKPFHQKGVVASLREFTVNAINHHHGMQPAERFGDGLDPDGDGVVNEVTRGDITAITIFQATLPPPGRVMPTNPSALEAVEQGEQLFSQVGCAVCHVPALPLRDPVFTEPGPYNPPGNLQLAEVPNPYSVDLTESGPASHLERLADGTVMVPVFTDMKWHNMGEALNNETLVQAGVPTDQWLTRRLWGMVSEPPFLHNGRASLISVAIEMHGGDAQEARDNFVALSAEGRASIVEFLKTVQVLPEGAEELVMQK